MRIISNPGAVYRSTTPEAHLAIVRANDAAREQAVAAMEALATSLVPGSTPYGTNHESGAFYMHGLHIEHGAEVEVPDGLRWDTKARRGVRVLVPAKKTEEGRVIDQQMSEVSFSPEPLGAVSKVLTITDGERIWFSQASIEVIGEDVYATYFHPLCDREGDRGLVEADAGWEPVPLSEFYAAREAQQPQSAKKVGA